MLVSRRQLKRLFVSVVTESLGFDDVGLEFDDKTEELIGWNDPNKQARIQHHKAIGSDNYVIQNLDNLDPMSMPHKDQIARINAIAEKLLANFEEKLAKQKSEKESMEAAKLAAYIEKLKLSGGVGTTMPLSRLVNDDTLI